MDTNHQNKDSEQNLVTELKSKIEYQKLQIAHLKREVHEADEKFLEMSQSSFWKINQKYEHLKNNNILIKIPYHLFKAIKNKHFKQSFKKLIINILEKVTVKILNEPEASNNNENEDLNDLLNSNYDILCFPDTPWDLRFQRTQKLLLKFSQKGHRIFYFNPFLKNITRVEIIRKKNSIYDISIPSSSNSKNSSSTLTSVKIDTILEVFEQYKINEGVIYINDPKWYPIVKELHDKHGMPLIYDINNSQFNTDEGNTLVHPNHLSLLEISHLNITSSKLFQDRFKTSTLKLSLIESGTDFELFNNPKSKSPLYHYKGSRIGYIGDLNEQIDIELLIKISTQFPDSHIFLIGGTIGFKSDQLSNLTNIYLLGEVSYNEIPSYLNDLDVCLLPLTTDQQFQTINTGKLFEYFSTGNPVVTTDLIELQPYSEQCFISKNHNEFLDNINAALKQKNNEGKENRIKIAKDYDWGNQFNTLNGSIKSSLPKVSIVIITYNCLEYTKFCIDSVLSKTSWPNYEILIIDNASADETPQYLREIEKTHEKIRVILNKDNLGFAGGNNLGIKEVDGDVVVLLNNDTIVTKGWLFGLVKHLKNDDVGMVGPVTNWTGNEAKIEVDYTDPKDMDAFARKYTLEHLNETMELRTLAMFCVAIKREVINKVGLLDERYKVGMFEDDDYATSVRRGGYKNICAEDVFIHHFGSVSFKKLDDEKYQKIFAENKKRFEDKWQEEWVPHKAR
jgi:O-antigen biosynthesis protein